MMLIEKALNWPMSIRIPVTAAGCIGKVTSMLKVMHVGMIGKMTKPQPRERVESMAKFSALGTP